MSSDPSFVTKEQGQSPMLPGMQKALPQTVARSLWYRTTSAASDKTGDSNTVRYGNTGNLFVYNTSYDSNPTATPTVPAVNGTFNTAQPAPLILPPTVCINPTTGLVDKTCTESGATINLNLPANPVFPSGSATNQPASSFTVCGVTGASRRYQAVEQKSNTLLADITGSTCPTNLGNPRNAIVNFASALRSLTASATPTGGQVQTVLLTGNGTSSAFTINALSSTRPNVIDLTAANFTSFANATTAANARLTLNANGNIDPTFVLRVPDTVGDVTIDGLNVRLNGVDPNKIFWVFGRTGANALTIKGSTVGKPTVLVGNFIGNMPASGAGSTTNTTGLNIGNTVNGKGISIRSARFLGFRGVTTRQAVTDAVTGATGVDSTAMITAMTTVNEPVVVPVLQLHSPLTFTVAPSTSLDTLPQPSVLQKYVNGINGAPPATTTDGTGQWTQRGSSATVNIYFVAGNTPSRSYVPYTTSASAVTPNTTIYTAETGGGLHNFVRFMENWSGQSLKIAGGFIQNTRSTFATATFSSTAPYTSLAIANCGSATYLTRDTCIETSSDIQTWFANPAAIAQPLSNFAKYYQSITVQSVPFYSPPRRLWGFDVGLLVQQPDLFAQRFSQALPNPNEFFRESSKDDPWVTNMLCALQPAPSVLEAGTVNPSTDPKSVNPTYEQRLGTKPSNYTDYALGIKDRPNTCDTLTASKLYSPTS